ncbi:MAG TPA: arsenite methyltransferase [Anaerolineales bacterium]|nr:arsenite methyltransferase [Anaerolineales bacterium]
MDRPDIKEDVRKHYAAIAERGCCGPACCSPESESAWIPESSLAEAPPPTEADLGLGCGSPTRAADLQVGERVLDLGSGAGADVFRAAGAIGPSGLAIGVDMTPEMIARARRIASERKYTNVEFRLGEIESLPVENNHVDVILSNCVLNLVPDKAKAFAEMYRVLRSGGRFVVSDIVTRGPVPDAVRRDAQLWAECLGGAIDEGEYLDGLRRAGFQDVAVLEAHAYEESGVGGTFVSVTVRGHKP